MGMKGDKGKHFPYPLFGTFDLSVCKCSILKSAINPGEITTKKEAGKIRPLSINKGI